MHHPSIQCCHWEYLLNDNKLLLMLFASSSSNQLEAEIGCGNHGFKGRILPSKALLGEGDETNSNRRPGVRHRVPSNHLHRRGDSWGEGSRGWDTTLVCVHPVLSCYRYCNSGSNVRVTLANATGQDTLCVSTATPTNPIPDLPGWSTTD